MSGTLAERRDRPSGRPTGRSWRSSPRRVTSLSWTRMAPGHACSPRRDTTRDGHRTGGASRSTARSTRRSTSMIDPAPPASGSSMRMARMSAAWTIWATVAMPRRHGPQTGRESRRRWSAPRLPSPSLEPHLGIITVDGSQPDGHPPGRTGGVVAAGRRAAAAGPIVQYGSLNRLLPSTSDGPGLRSGSSAAAPSVQREVVRILVAARALELDLHQDVVEQRGCAEPEPVR